MSVPPDTEKLMGSLFEEGHTLRDVARITGYTVSQVKTRLRKQGIRRPVENPLDHMEVLKLYRLGHSAYRIAKILGKTTWSISALLRELIPDYKSKREYQRKNVKAVDWDAVVQAYHNGARRADLAEYNNVSLSRLGLEFRLRGVPILNNRLIREKQHGRKITINVPEVIRMRAKGLSYNRIGQLIGCTGTGARSAWLRWNKSERNVVD